MRENLGDKMNALTPQMLRQQLSPLQYNNFANNFRLALDPAQREEYKNKSRAERDGWIAQWAIDPETALSTGYNKDCVYNDELSINDDEWVTQSVLGGPRYFNDAMHADILVKPGEMQERPSRHAALAAHGVKEYKITSEIFRAIEGKKRSWC